MEHSLTDWRDGAHEVDFVVTRGLDVWAIEVKSGRRGMPSDFVRAAARPRR